MSPNEFASFMISYFLTFVVMLFVDRKIKISGFVRSKLKINTKGKMVWTSSAVALLVGFFMLYVLGWDSSYRAIASGAFLGMIIAVQAGISSAFTNKRSSIQK